MTGDRDESRNSWIRNETLQDSESCVKFSIEALDTRALHQLGSYLFACNPFRRSTIVTEQKTKYGFTAFAETWNGRLAMMGFVIGIATEFITGQGILSQLGLL
jgi:hypothetical protein